MRTPYTTAVGDQRTVTPTVLLNELSGHLRRIELTRGEALFRVAHDPARRFEVHALQGVTTAVGTQFDVRILRGAAVSVLEGTVTVGSGVGYSEQGTLLQLHPAQISRIQGWCTQHVVSNDMLLASATQTVLQSENPQP